MDSCTVLVFVCLSIVNSANIDVAVYFAKFVKNLSFHLKIGLVSHSVFGGEFS